ncbi:MAG TPA: hypothetical protein VGF65_05905, partial [Mycobacterium sp.]
PGRVIVMTPTPRNEKARTPAKKRAESGNRSTAPGDQPQMVGINVPIPVRLHTRVRLYAVREGMTMREVVIAALTEFTR